MHYRVSSSRLRNNSEDHEVLTPFVFYANLQSMVMFIVYSIEKVVG